MDTIVWVKIVTALLYPAGLVLMLVMASGVFRLFHAKRLQKLSLLFGVLVLITASNPHFANVLVSRLEHRFPQQAISEILKHDAIIVLGGGLRIPLPPAQHTQIGAGSDRLWYAVRLYREGLAERVILTGGNVYEQAGYASEAEYAAELLREWGVPESAIVIETSSRTTRQNQENTAKLLKQYTIESALLVTSAIHMPRAYALFARVPIIITPASADVMVRQHRSPGFLGWIPSASALMLSTVALHEYYGLFVDSIYYAGDD